MWLRCSSWARRHCRTWHVPGRELAPLVPEEGVGMQRAPLLLLCAVPCIDANAEGRLAVTSKELKLLRMVSALEAKSYGCSIPLHRSSVMTRRPACEQVLGKLSRGWCRARSTTRMRDELGAAVVLRHGDHAGRQAELMIRRNGHDILLLTLEPACTFGNVPRVHTPEELGVDFARRSCVFGFPLAPAGFGRTPGRVRSSGRRCKGVLSGNVAWC